MKFLEKTKAIPSALKRRFLMIGTAMMALVASVVPAFAASSGSAAFTVTAGDLQPLLDSITANVKVVFPIMLIITGVFIIIMLVPRLIKKATHGS